MPNSTSAEDVMEHEDLIKARNLIHREQDRAKRVRKRLESEAYQRYDKYAFVLSGTQLSPEEFDVILSAAIWERFSGFEPKSSDDLTAFIVAVIQEFTPTAFHG